MQYSQIAVSARLPLRQQLLYVCHYDTHHAQWTSGAHGRLQGSVLKDCMPCMDTRMQAHQSLHEAYHPLLEDDGSDSSKDGGGSGLGSASDDSADADCAMAWAVPAAGAAGDVSWLIFPPAAPLLLSRSSRMSWRSRLLLLACALCTMAALAAAIATIMMPPSAQTPAVREAGVASKSENYRQLHCRSARSTIMYTCPSWKPMQRQCWCLLRALILSSRHNALSVSQLPLYVATPLI